MPTIQQRKDAEIIALKTLGETKEMFDKLLARVEQATVAVGFDRYNEETNVNFFVMAQNSNGNFEKQSLVDFVEAAEKLPLEEYKRTMSDLFEQRNIHAYEPSNIVPTSWGFFEGLTELTAVIKKGSTVIKGISNNNEGRAPVTIGTGMTLVDRIEEHLLSDNPISNNVLTVLTEDEIKNKIAQTDFNRVMDLPDREEMPFYLKNNFLRKFLSLFSDTFNEQYRRINVVENAYKIREALVPVLHADALTRVESLITQANILAERQNTLLEKHIANQTTLKEKLTAIEKTTKDNTKEINNNRTNMIKQAVSIKKTGWRIQDIFGEKTYTRGFGEKEAVDKILDLDKIPKNVKIKTDKELTDKNQAYFNFSKMLTAIYSAKEGSPLNEAIKSIIPNGTAIKDVPSTFVARQMLLETFSGKQNENMNKLLQPLIIETKNGANNSLQDYAQGNVSSISKDIQAGATVLLNVLNSTTPDEFVSQTSKWPIAAKCLKELYNITEKIPEIVSSNPELSSKMNEIKGWAKISEVIEQSALSQQQLAKSTLPPAEKEQALENILLESKLRGICAKTFANNSTIDNTMSTNGIDLNNTFSKELLIMNKGYIQNDSKPIILLGESDNTLSNIKKNIVVDKALLNADTATCVGWILKHLEDNNKSNIDTTINYTKIENDNRKKAEKETAKTATHDKKDEAKQLKSDLDMIKAI